MRAVSEQHIGRPRRVVADLPAYRPGKGAKQAEAEHGIENAIKLASNENPSEPLDAIVQAVCDAARGLNRYADHRAGAVRQALATRLGVDVERVTVGNGSVGLLQQVALTYLDDGDEALYPWRSFEAYPIYTALAGAESVQIPLAPDLGFDIDRLIDSVTPRTRVVFLSTPNNPTGVAMTTKEITTLVEAIPGDVMVVVDEAYREFLDPGFGDPITEVVPRHPNVLVMRTFSKAHALAGLRIGYAVGHPDVITDVDKTLVPFAVNALAQAAALAALEHEDVIAQQVQAILAERARVEVELAADGWELPNHQTNFVYLSLGARADDIAYELEKRGVVIRPFSGEGIRVTIGTPEQNDRFLATLHEVARP